jgi:hypothetical protein
LTAEISHALLQLRIAREMQGRLSRQEQEVNDEG